MQNDDNGAESIRAFLESPENKSLFSNCPFRQFLSCLHEFDPEEADIIVAHMIGHIIDYKSGEVGVMPNRTVPSINQDGLEDAVRYIYNDCNNQKLNEARKLAPGLNLDNHPEYRGFGPEQRGCFDADARAELMAEAIRAYMRNPNYIKTVAPAVAARIRDAVNPNPRLNRIIQFN